LKYDTWRDAEGKNRHRHSIAAERIVFLNNRQDGDVVGMGESERGGVDAMSFDPVMVDSQPQKAPRAKRATSDTKFKDVQPFEDDLPF